MLQLLNSLFWVSWDILISVDEIALVKDCPPIRISRDTQNKLYNKELVSRLPKVAWQITTHQHCSQFSFLSLSVILFPSISLFLCVCISLAMELIKLSFSVFLSLSISLSLLAVLKKWISVKWIVPTLYTE